VLAADENGEGGDDDNDTGARRRRVCGAEETGELRAGGVSVVAVASRNVRPV
jgi:hypothetical protein